MSLRRVRFITDVAITYFTCWAIAYAGAGWWALLVIPFGLWNFYDGMTRDALPKD